MVSESLWSKRKKQRKALEKKRHRRLDQGEERRREREKEKERKREREREGELMSLFEDPILLLKNVLPPLVLMSPLPAGGPLEFGFAFRRRELH